MVGSASRPASSVMVMRHIAALMSSRSVRGQFATNVDDVGCLRQHEILELWRVRKWHVVRGDPPYRRVEPLEAALVDTRRDLARESAGARVLVYDERAIRFLHGR